MFDAVEMDAVVIATSNDNHHDLALEAIERGLHVLCEKPLARNAEEGAAMVAAADAENNQSQRWLTFFAELAAHHSGTVFDLGCGPGKLVDHLAQLGLTVIG